MFNRKVISNLDLNDIGRMIGEQFDCKVDSIDFKDMKIIYDVYLELQEGINNYRDERVQEFVCEDNRIHYVIFHAIPLDAFLRSRIDSKKAKVSLSKKQFFIGSYSQDFEGLHNELTLSHNRLFRNGIFEVVIKYENRGDVNVSNPKSKFKEFVSESLDVYSELGISCPIVYFVTFTNVEGQEMATKPDVFTTAVTERNILDPAGVVINDKDQVDNEVHNIFVPILNDFGINDYYLFDESAGN
ncbi:hypothetical protein [uncultured Methanobrevibacter sp.]|uniref:hypothetical protein n=1 Tax=uncultured Methanobrevibacter sp. TaxID=253161 RepID=UPI0025DBD3FC|nr:hypothetical protein [uncultured Methanobrevibacter sp.]